MEQPFRMLWFARTSSSVGDALVPVALPFAVLRVGGGPSGLGLVLATFTLGRAIFIIVGGVWADRLPRRLVMLACDVVRGLVDVFIALALLAGTMRLWMFLITALVFGAAGSFFAPASTGLVPQTVSAPRLQKANALLSLSQNATNVFGPALSGLIVATAGTAWVFAIDAVSFVTSAAFLLALRIAPHVRPPAQRFLADIAEGWREIRGRTWLWSSFVVFALGNLGLGPLFVLGPLLARSELGGAPVWGGILTASAIGGVLGGFVIMRLRPRRPLLVAFAAWTITAAPLFALAPPLSAPAIAVGMALFGFGLAVANTIWETVLQHEIPKDRISRVSGFDWMLSLVFMPIGQAVAGPLSTRIGIRITLLIAAGLMTVPDVLAVAMVPAIRALRLSPASQPVPEPAER